MYAGRLGHPGAACAWLLWTTATSCRRRIRRRAPHSQRPRRQTPRHHRALPRGRRCIRCRQAGTRARIGSLSPWRRSQRGRARRPRRRSDDRSRAHDRNPCRPARPPGTCARWCPLVAVQSRNSDPWSRNDRRCRRQHGNRWAHARRRPRLVDAQVWPGARQPPLSRDGHGGRQLSHAQAPTRTPICFGRFAEEAATSGLRHRSSMGSIRSDP